jgi:adenosylcobinamide-GDP ribazoletransferase
MIRQARLFLCALQFMTRLPAPQLSGFQPDWIARSAPYYPVVGWIVGAVPAAIILVASRLWPGLPAAVLALGAGLLVTGAFHEDGLADTADGLGGGQTPARRLQIMKDSRVGTYGVLALGVVLGLKTVTLAGMDPPRAALALILIHGAARAFVTPVMAMLPYVGGQETAKLGAGAMRVRPMEAATALLLGIAPMFFLVPIRPLLLGLGLAAAAASGLALMARRLIGGFTGDVLGAVEQMAELGLLLGLAARGLAAQGLGA